MLLKGVKFPSNSNSNSKVIKYKTLLEHSTHLSLAENKAQVSYHSSKKQKDQKKILKLIVKLCKWIWFLIAIPLSPLLALFPYNKAFVNKLFAPLTLVHSLTRKHTLTHTHSYNSHSVKRNEMKRREISQSCLL